MAGVHSTDSFNPDSLAAYAQFRGFDLAEWAQHFSARALALAELVAFAIPDYPFDTGEGSAYPNRFPVDTSDPEFNDYDGPGDAAGLALYFAEDLNAEEHAAEVTLIVFRAACIVARRVELGRADNFPGASTAPPGASTATPKDVLLQREHAALLKAAAAAQSTAAVRKVATVCKEFFNAGTCARAGCKFVHVRA